jgi:hypothetical protein
LTENRHLTLALEVKIKWGLSSDNIVEVYSRNIQDLTSFRVSPVSVVNPIHQINGYLCHNKL